MQQDHRNRILGYITARIWVDEDHGDCLVRGRFVKGLDPTDVDPGVGDGFEDVEVLVGGEWVWPGDSHYFDAEFVHACDESLLRAYRCDR